MYGYTKKHSRPNNILLQSSCAGLYGRTESAVGSMKSAGRNQDTPVLESLSGLNSCDKRNDLQARATICVTRRLFPSARPSSETTLLPLLRLESDAVQLRRQVP